jgi:hypothetical protein
MKWKYFTIEVKTAEVQDCLEKQGKDGWELVYFGPKPNPIWAMMIFKKQIEPKKKGWPKGKKRGPKADAKET